MFLLVALTRSEWWDFDEAGISAKVANSAEVPLYFICYSATCPYCRGIHQRFQGMASAVTLDRRVIFTALNCTRFPTSCGTFRVRSYPSLRYISSPNPEYWDSLGYQATQDWDLYIRRRVRKNMIDAGSLSPTDVSEKVLQTVKGSIVIGLRIGKPEGEVFERYADESMKYRKEKASFLWWDQASEPELAVWLGPECRVSTKDVTTMSDFLRGYQFGHFRKWTIEDFRARSSLAGIVFTADDDISEKEERLLHSLSKALCGKLALGWAPAQSRLGREIFGRSNGEPFIGLRGKRCNATFPDLTENEVMNFLTDAVQGTEKGECAKIERMIDARLIVGILTLVIIVPLAWLVWQRANTVPKDE
jgi:hypothetical protein